MESLFHLKRLYIYDNRIESFKDLDNLENLKYLDLNYNLFFQADEYQMPLREAKEYFGHLKKLLMLNGHLYPDNDFYTFLRGGRATNVWI